MFRTTAPEDPTIDEATTSDATAVAPSAENTEPAPTTTTEAAPPAPLTSTHQIETIDAPTPTDANLASATDYALHLPTSTVDEEIKKRQARAARFGTASESTEIATKDDATLVENGSKDDQESKNFERAKRFGTTPATMGKLDEALPSERERGSRKRALEESGGNALDDPGLKKRSGGRGGSRGRGNRLTEQRPGRRDNGERPRGAQKHQGSSAAFSSDRDRQAAEARKKKFGGATA